MASFPVPPHPAANEDALTTTVSAAITYPHVGFFMGDYKAIAAPLATVEYLGEERSPGEDFRPQGWSGA